MIGHKLRTVENFIINVYHQYFMKQLANHVSLFYSHDDTGSLTKYVNTFLKLEQNSELPRFQVFAVGSSPRLGLNREI